MPGIRVEKLTASIVISRFIRRATSVKRSIWKPSTPPPSLGMAWGAKVPSTPVRRGGSFSWASAGAAQRSAAAAIAAKWRDVMANLLARPYGRKRTRPLSTGFGGHRESPRAITRVTRHQEHARRRDHEPQDRQSRQGLVQECPPDEGHGAGNQVEVRGHAAGGPV